MFEVNNIVVINVAFQYYLTHLIFSYVIPVRCFFAWYLIKFVKHD